MKKYRKLKGRLFERGHQQTDICAWLVRSLAYVNKCLNAKNEGFNNSEMLILMDRLGIPDEEWGLYFGRAEREGR